MALATPNLTIADAAAAELLFNDVSPVTALTPAASIEIPRAKSGLYTLTPTATTTITLGTAASGALDTVLVVVQGSTPYAVNLPSGLHWVDGVAGAVSAVANAVSVVSFTTVSGVGTIASAYVAAVP